MTRQLAVMVDRDGTTASVHHIAPGDRSNSSWAAYNAALPFDSPVPSVVALLQSVRDGVTVIMVSGRAEGDWPGDRRRRFQMQDWIVKHQIPVDLLLMRSGGDTRRDSIVKREIYENLIEPQFDVRMVIDDRPQVCEVWRDLDLPLIQVTDPQIMPTIGT